MVEQRHAVLGCIIRILSAVIPRERLEEMVRAYYAARGWDSGGYVPPRLMKDLDLELLGGPQTKSSPQRAQRPHKEDKKH